MTITDSIILDDAGVARCRWCAGDALYERYHDCEWGFPSLPGIDLDTRLFEKICLEGFQAGLSWLTILRKRENFRRAFRGFDIDRVARMTRRDVERLLGNAGIVRHRGKIESTINNARRAIDVREACGSLAAFVWRFQADPSPPARRTLADVPAQSPESKALSRELRRRGWSFVGPTTMYAFMQSVGVVNDHVEGCSVFDHAERARRAFAPPA